MHHSPTRSRARLGAVAGSVLLLGAAVAAVGAGSNAGAVVVPVSVPITCDDNGDLVSVGSSLITDELVPELAATPIPLAVEGTVDAPDTVAAGATLDYSVTITQDFDALASSTLVDTIKPAIQAATGPNLANTAALNLHIDDLVTQVPVPQGTTLVGVPTATASPGAPTPTVSVDGGVIAVEVDGLVANASQANSFVSTTLPDTGMFSVTLDFQVLVNGVAPGGAVELRAGDVSFAFGEISDTVPGFNVSVKLSNNEVAGGANGTFSCPTDVPDPLLFATAVDTEAPGAPTGATATPGDMSLLASWTAPASDGGSPITEYTVTADPGGNQCVADVATPSCTLLGLTNGTPYTFTVVATNAVGDSEPSAPSAPVTPRTITAPGAPTDVTATPGDMSLLASWTAPADDGGSPITGYTATASPVVVDGGGAATAAVAEPSCSTTGATSCTIEGLVNDQPYTVTVVASNDQGDSEPSAPSDPATPTATPVCGPEAPDGPFPDVDPLNLFCDDIDWLAMRGVTTGDGEGNFNPTVPVSRGSMAAFLYRFADEPLGPDPTCDEETFSDVTASNPFCGYISWLVAEGITTGFGDGTYGPAVPVSRQSMAAFLYRFADEPLGPDPTCDPGTFTDVDGGNAFCGYITWLVDEGIAAGFDDETFRPQLPVSRQAMAKFLHTYDMTQVEVLVD